MLTPQQMVDDLVHYGDYSQSEIAGRIGVTPTTVSRLINGETQDPAYSVGKKLEELYESRRQHIKEAKLARVHELTRDLEGPVTEAKV